MFSRDQRSVWKSLSAHAGYQRPITHQLEIAQFHCRGVRVVMRPDHQGLENPVRYDDTSSPRIYFVLMMFSDPALG